MEITDIMSKWIKTEKRTRLCTKESVEPAGGRGGSPKPEPPEHHGIAEEP